MMRGGGGAGERRRSAFRWRGGGHCPASIVEGKRERSASTPRNGAAPRDSPRERWRLWNNCAEHGTAPTTGSSPTDAGGLPIHPKKPLAKVRKQRNCCAIYWRRSIGSNKRGSPE